MAAIHPEYEVSVPHLVSEGIDSSDIYSIDRKLNILKELKGYIKLSICMMFVHLSISACVITNSNIILSLVPVIIYYIILLYTSFALYPSELNKLNLFYQITEYTCILISIIILFSIYMLDKYRYIYSIYPLMISLGIKVLKSGVNKFRCSNGVRIITGVWSILRVLMFINLSVKIDDVVQWSWIEVLWPVWTVLGIMGIVGIIAFTVILGGVISCITNENNTRNAVCVIWIGYTCLVGSASIGVFMYYLVLSLEYHRNINSLGLGSIFPTLYFACFCIFTQIYLPEITIWCDRYLPSNLHLPISISIDPFSQNLSIPNESIHNLSSQSLFTISTRKTLKRISNTYFKQVQVETPIQNCNINKSYSKPDLESSVCSVHRRAASTSVPMTEFTIESNPLVSGKRVVCVTCCENECDAVFMICGHGGICHTCALEMFKTKGKCHLCRKTISQVLQVEIEDIQYIQVISTTQRIQHRSRPGAE